MEILIESVAIEILNLRKKPYNLKKRIYPIILNLIACGKIKLSVYAGCVYVCAYVYKCVCLCVCVCLCTCMCKRVHIGLCKCTFMYVCVCNFQKLWGWDSLNNFLPIIFILPMKGQDKENGYFASKFSITQLNTLK